MDQPSTLNVEVKNGKGKVNAKEVRNEMNQTWRKKFDGSSSSNCEVVITKSNGLGDSPISN